MENKKSREEEGLTMEDRPVKSLPLLSSPRGGALSPRGRPSLREKERRSRSRSSPRPSQAACFSAVGSVLFLFFPSASVQ